MVSLKKVSKSNKTNIAGGGGSGNRLKDLATVNTPATEPINNNNNSNNIGPLHSRDTHIFISVREPWKWVIEDVCNSENFETITFIDDSRDLPSGKLASLAAIARASNASNTHSDRRRHQKNTTTTSGAHCTLRIEIVSNQLDNNHNTGQWTMKAFHCTSQAFDGLDDKDELARTLKRCRCEQMDFSPSSQLINWDVTKEECKNLVGDSLPSLLGERRNHRSRSISRSPTRTTSTSRSPTRSKNPSTCIAVLKEPMGSMGTGVFFVRDYHEIHAIIEKHRQEAISEDGFLDKLIAEKGRIPSWVLQAEVRPCLLIRNRRKFHIRTYVICVETNVLLNEPIDGEEEEDLMTIYIYNRHEIRIASEPVPTSDQEEPGQRDRGAHITETFDRKLLQDEPELTKRNLNTKIESFVAKAFDALAPDIERRVAMRASILDEENDNTGGCMVLPHKFAIAGLDLMVTEDESIYLLEVNVNPAAPPPETVSPEFTNHLTGLLHDILELVTSKTVSKSGNFCSTKDVLQR
mmetsp:Transcript_32387/g.36247  ORF Transcript_32387/g.36247 Transcript_32387/m.36247 type:complete len:521 (-) Transcript_32387:123-1685(-)